MNKFENFAVPIQKLRGDRDFITDKDIMEQPGIANFVKRFPDYWKRHPLLDGYAGPYPDEIKKLTEEKSVEEQP